jgi:hypothetical protein
MVNLGDAMRLKPFPDVRLGLLQRPHIQINHLNRGLWIALLGLMAAEVPNQSADTQTYNALALDLLNQEPVDV